MEKLSNFFNETYYQHLSNLIKEVYPAFEKDKFYKDVIFELEKHELMQRLRNTALLFHKYLTNDYRNNVKILKEVSQTFGVPTVTDIHEAHEAALAAEYVDVLQIPAFLCRPCAPHAW